MPLRLLCTSLWWRVPTSDSGDAVMARWLQSTGLQHLASPLASTGIDQRLLPNLLMQYFNKKRRKSLIQALDKVKSELLLLGFISLLLTVCERPIAANICIPKSVGETFLPCGSFESDAEEETKCAEQGKLSWMSREGVQQLLMLIFVLAVFHVFSCFLTFSLGIAK